MGQEVLDESFYRSLATLEVEPRKEKGNKVGVDVAIRPRVALDVDGTLLDDDGLPFDGAVEFTKELSKTHDIIIHSCRVSEDIYDTPERRVDKLRIRLERLGFSFKEIWYGKGKPLCFWYIDDRAVCCNPKEDDYAFESVINVIRNKIL